VPLAFLISCDESQILFKRLPGLIHGKSLSRWTAPSLAVGCG
jgi:hypothetical protein